MYTMRRVAEASERVGSDLERRLSLALQHHLRNAQESQEKYAKIARNPYVSTLERNLFATARPGSSRPQSPPTGARLSSTAPTAALQSLRPSTARPARTPLAARPAWDSSTGAWEMRWEMAWGMRVPVSEGGMHVCSLQGSAAAATHAGVDHNI